MYVIATGNPADGFTLYGPLEDDEEFDAESFRKDNWWIMKIEPIDRQESSDPIKDGWVDRNTGRP